MSFLAGRLVHGIASAFTSIAALSILAELYSSDLERSKVMGVAMGGVAFGVVGKPFINTFLKTVIIMLGMHNSTYIKNYRQSKITLQHSVHFV